MEMSFKFLEFENCYGCLILYLYIQSLNEKSERQDSCIDKRNNLAPLNALDFVRDIRFIPVYELGWPQCGL